MDVFNNTISDEDLRSILNVKKETRSGQYIIDFCPFCNKSEHFYINKFTQRWDCKKCGESGGIYKLLKHFDKLYLLGAPTVKLADEIKSIREIQEDISKAENAKIEPLPEIKMPAGFKVYDYITPYLSQRGISMEDVKHWNFGRTKIVSRYIDYLLIPIYDEGKVRGFIGRYASKHVPEDKLRYSNSIHTDFSCLLFGYDDIIKGKTDTVIITEGLFDAIAVTKKLNLFADFSIRAVCTFGKKISKTQIQKLLAKEIRRVILLYDYDALKETRHYASLLNEYFETRVAVALGKKDIDECTLSEVIDVFENIKPVQKFNLDVARKMKH